MSIRNLRVTRSFSGLGQSSDCATNQQALSAKQAELSAAYGNPAMMGMIPILQGEVAELAKKANDSCTNSSGSSAFKDFTSGLTTLLTAAAPAAAQIYTADQARRAQKTPQGMPFTTPVVINAAPQSSNGLIIVGVIGIAALATIGLMMSKKSSTPTSARKIRRRRRKH